jgi:hypothetical protein
MTRGILASVVAASLAVSASAVAAQPPIDLGTRHASEVGAPNYANAAVTFPDGALESYFRRGLDGKLAIFRTRSTDHGKTWSAPEVVTQLVLGPWGGPIPLLDQEGELHFVIPKGRESNGRKPGIDRFIDLWHVGSSEGRTKWSEPKLVYEGYCGSLQGIYQTKSGRILVPFADWLPGVPLTPPSGPEVVICMYSDDGGNSWKRSPAKLTSPVHEAFNGANYGACEPSLIQLKDGRVWMLLRTQTGFLYESFSEDNGTTWSEAKPSRFHSSNSPAYQVRLDDGRLVVFWNNCDHCPRVGKDGVYSGRDALHAAISDDEGKTWRGFREVYRDPTRNASPPKSGDRGTAYPHATVTKDNKILLVSGQGAELRRRFLIDPEWLLETSQSEGFTNLDAWHYYKGFGQPKGWWRDRVPGPQLIKHPYKPDANVLHVRRPDERAADGAVWNFPAAKNGELTLRIRAEKDFGGATICLADFMLDPCDDTAAARSNFSINIDASGRFSETGSLTPGQWHTLKLSWDGKKCEATLDDKPAGEIAMIKAAPDGVSYLRLRSIATAVDTAGFLIESVNMTVK